MQPCRRMPSQHLCASRFGHWSRGQVRSQHKQANSQLMAQQREIHAQVNQCASPAVAEEHQLLRPRNTQNFPAVLGPKKNELTEECGCAACFFCGSNMSLGPHFGPGLHQGRTLHHDVGRSSVAAGANEGKEGYMPEGSRPDVGGRFRYPIWNDHSLKLHCT